MASSPNTPVQETITLDFQGKGMDGVKGFMSDHEAAWKRIAGSVEGIGSRIEGIARSIGGLAGVVGIGAIVSDFARLETSANNAALAIGRVTGAQSQWAGLAQGLLGLQASYGINPQQSAAAVVTAASMAGGGYSNSQALGIAKMAGLYGLGTGLSPELFGQVIGQSAQAQNVSATTAAAQLPTVMATLGLGGFHGQALGSALQTTGGLATMLATMNPGNYGGSGYMTEVSAEQAAAARANNLYRDSGAFASGFTGIASGLMGAASNPRTAAFLQMAGVGVSAMISGNPTPGVRAKILRAAEAMYPDPNVRILALRTMFGVDGAKLLLTGDAGHVANAAQTAASQQQLMSAAAGTMQTLGIQQQRLRGRIESPMFGPFSTGQGSLMNILGWATQDPLHMLLGYGGYRAAKAGLGRGLGAAGRKIGEALVKDPGVSSLAERVAAAGGFELADVGGAAGAGWFASAAGIGAKLLGPVGALAMFGINADDAGPSLLSHRQGQHVFRYAEAKAASDVVRAAQLKFGSKWTTRAAHDWMNQQLRGQYAPLGEIPMALRERLAAAADPAKENRQLLSGAGGLLDSYLGIVHGHAGDASLLHRLGAQQYGEVKFAQAVDKFSQIVDKMGGRIGVSYTPGTSGATFVGASGAQALGASAPGFELASFHFGGGSNTTFASYALNSGGGGGGGGGGAPSGGGWQPCTLTWYDPALGGTNSSNGARNPHSKTASGQPYDASAMTCAAPPGYAFGTKITFAYGKKTVTCTVNDRGGAIQGAHFDLSRGAASALGMIAAGVVQGQFKVLGGGASASGASGRSAAAGGGLNNPSTASGHVVSAIRSAAGAFGGAGGDTHIHVHIDGREISKQRVLTRGSV